MPKENQTPFSDIYATLHALDLSGKVKTKPGAASAKYIPWSVAYEEIISRYPDMTFAVREWDSRPWLYDSVLGYIVETSVTICGHTRSMRLPVMDSANNAKLDHVTTITMQGRSGSYDKTVQAATMFDVNTAVMRCLVKNLSLFGFGLYIYAGDEEPAEVREERAQKAQEAMQRVIQQRIATLLDTISGVTEKNVLAQIWKENADLHNNDQFKNAVKQRGEELKNETKQQQ